MSILHFIWLGKNRIPREIINTWKPQKNDKYKIIVWRDYPDDKEDYDKDIKDLGELHNEKLFKESEKYNQKSDILRLEILYKYGGIYMDCDIVRIPGGPGLIKTLIKSTGGKKMGRFYITYEKAGCVSNSLIYVSSPRNKVVKFLINGLADCKIKDEDGKYISVCKSTGPKYITDRLTKYGWDMNNVLPYHFVNFGIDYSKNFVDEKFKITDKMKNAKFNKDLRYKPVFDSIVGIQLWMGGKKTNYDNVNNLTVNTALANYKTYSDMVKKHYECADTKFV